MFNERIHSDASRHLTVVNTMTVPSGGTGVDTKELAQIVLDVVDESAKLIPDGVAIMPEDDKLGGSVEGGVGEMVTVRGPLTILTNTTSAFTISNFDIKTTYFISSTEGRVWRDMDSIYLEVGAYTGALTVTINHSTFVVEVKPVVINKPAPTNLQDGQTNVGSKLTLKTSAYVSSIQTTFHKSSDWQLSKDPAFKKIVKEVKNSITSLLSWPVEDLEPDTRYFIRTRYRDNVDNVSEWSDTTTFQTRFSFVPTTPVIQTPSDKSNGQWSTVKLQSSGFETTETGVSHVSTDWEVSTSSVFLGNLFESKQDKVNLTSWTIKDLSESTTHYTRVRYIDSKGGVSEWSPTHAFKTRDSFGASTPLIVSPQNAVTEQNSIVDVTVSAFIHAVEGVNHASTDWELSEDSTFAYPQFKSYSDGQNLKTWRVQKLKPKCKYWVRVRYRDTNSSVSDWSDAVSFTTKDSFVPKKPVIVFPLHRSNSGTYAMTFRADIFVSGDLGSTHHNSDWELSTNASFTNIVKSALSTMNNKTQWLVNRLNSETLYFLRVRYRSINSGVTYESEWSDTISFSVKYVEPTTPGIISPANGAEVSHRNQINFTSSSFVEGMPGEVHANTDWQLSLSEDFSTIFKTVLASPAYKTSWSVVGLDAGQTYYVKVRYRTSSGRQTQWSPVTTLATKPLEQAVLPYITNPNDGTKNIETESIRFTCSAFDIVLEGDSHESTDWELSAEANFQTTLESVYNSASNKTSWVVYGLANSTEFYVRVRHTGSKSGSTRWSAPTKFTTIAPVTVYTPGTPEIVSPADGSSKNPRALMVRSSSFYSGNKGDTHLTSDWELATDPTFEVIEKSVYGSVGYKTSWSIADLFSETIYYVRVRYLGKIGGYGEWSRIQTFKTGAKITAGGVATVNDDGTVSSGTGGGTTGGGTGTGTGTGSTGGGTTDGGGGAVVRDPSTPEITYPSKTEDKEIPTTLTFLCSDFISATNQDHLGSLWTLVKKDPTSVYEKTDIVQDSGRTSRNKTSWMVEGLKQDTEYGIYVKHIAAASDSLDSKTQWFRTAIPRYVDKPVIVFPVVLGKIDGLVVEGSVFSTNKEGLLHHASDWELFDDTNTLIYSLYDSLEQKTTLELGKLFTGLVKDKSVKVRVRYKAEGGDNETSVWSEKTQFKLTDIDTTLAAVITSPTAGEKLPAHPYIAITIDPHATTFRALKYMGMEVELSDTAVFTPGTVRAHTRAKDNYLDGKTSKTFFIPSHKSSGNLYIRAKVFDSSGNEPVWSAIINVELETSVVPLREVARIRASDNIDSSDYYGFSIDFDTEGRMVVIGDPTATANNPQSPMGDNIPTARGLSFVHKRTGDAWQNRLASRVSKDDVTSFAKGQAPFVFYPNLESYWNQPMAGKSVSVGTSLICQSYKQPIVNYKSTYGDPRQFSDDCVLATLYTTNLPDTSATLEYPIILKSGTLMPVYTRPISQSNSVQTTFNDAYVSSRIDGETINAGVLNKDRGVNRNSPHSGNSICVSGDDSTIVTTIPMLNAVHIVKNLFVKIGHISEYEAWAQANSATRATFKVAIDNEKFFVYSISNESTQFFEIVGSLVEELGCKNGWPVVSPDGQPSMTIERDSTYFGISSAVNADGTIIYIGCLGLALAEAETDGTGTCSTGYVLKYKYSGSKWELVGKVSGRGYGMDVACDSTGEYFVTGGFKKVMLQYTSDTPCGASVFPRRPQAKQSVSVQSTTGTMVYGKMGEALKEVVYIGKPDSASLEFRGYGGSSKSEHGLSRTPGSPNLDELKRAFPYAMGLDPRYLRQLGAQGNSGFDVHFGKKVAMTGAGIPVTAGRNFIQYSNAYLAFGEAFPIRDIAVSGDGKFMAVSAGSFREDSQVIIYGL